MGQLAVAVVVPFADVFETQNLLASQTVAVALVVLLVCVLAWDVTLIPRLNFS